MNFKSTKFTASAAHVKTEHAENRGPGCTCLKAHMLNYLHIIKMNKSTEEVTIHSHIPNK